MCSCTGGPQPWIPSLIFFPPLPSPSNPSCIHHFQFSYHPHKPVQLSWPRSRVYQLFFLTGSHFCVSHGSLNYKNEPVISVYSVLSKVPFLISIDQAAVKGRGVIQPYFLISWQRYGTHTALILDIDLFSVMLILSNCWTLFLPLQHHSVSFNSTAPSIIFFSGSWDNCIWSPHPHQENRSFPIRQSTSYRIYLSHKYNAMFMSLKIIAFHCLVQWHIRVGCWFTES